MLKKYFLTSFIFLFLLLIYQGFCLQEVKRIETEGLASIKEGDVAAARDQAIEDALRRAVEQTVGTIVESETVVQNYALLSDRIYTKSDGYVTRYEILEEDQQEKLYRVKALVDVGVDKLKDDLSAIGLLIRRMKKPRVMVMITDENIQGQSIFDRYVASISQSEGIMIRKLREKGFMVVDAAQVKQNLDRDEAVRAFSGDNQIASLLGNQAGAEVVIVGQAIAAPGGRVGNSNLISHHATITVRAIKTGSAEVIAQADAEGAAVHVTPLIGAQNAIKQSAEELADIIIEQILEKWASEATSIRSISLLVVNIQEDQLTKLKIALENNVRGVERVYTRSFNADTAQLEIEFKGDGEVLAAELKTLSFDGCSIELIGFAQDKVEIRIYSK
jgi:hypothetical protein